MCATKANRSIDSDALRHSAAALFHFSRSISDVEWLLFPVVTGSLWPIVAKARRAELDPNWSYAPQPLQRLDVVGKGEMPDFGRREVFGQQFGYSS